jgi:hypothetical protein
LDTAAEAVYSARQELAALEVQLDQCWDLLRQRRVRTEFGEDPGTAPVRPPAEVEGYESSHIGSMGSLSTPNLSSRPIAATSALAMIRPHLLGCERH